jgi:predicted DNA-binding transcriptional regulator YafY
VRFAFPESHRVANSGVGGLVREEPDPGGVIEFDVRDRESFVRWLLSFGRQAEIEEPAELRDSLATLRADVAAMYAETAL